jgi:hypothetical protein
MLELHSGQTGEKIIVTLTELTTITYPYYLFVFTHTETKNVVKFVAGADESPYPYRYNQFTVDTSLFAPDGYWLYEVHEQESATNTDPATSGAIVEYGKMILYKASEFEYEQYNEPVTYKAYNG